MNKITLLSLLLIVMVGCALGERYRQATDSWLGAPVEEVIMAWGVPELTEPLPQGERKYIWRELIVEVMPRVIVDEVTGAVTSIDESITYVCDREMTSDSLGRIKYTWNSYECWRSDYTPPSRPGAVNPSGG